jgi:DNA-binding beta-propeller fold protein YncE
MSKTWQLQSVTGSQQQELPSNFNKEGGVNKTLSVGLTFSAYLALLQLGIAPDVFAQYGGKKEFQAVSEQTATGFVFPESVAYDPKAKVLYVSEFGSELKPTQKDGKGRISKVSGTVLNKPKGIWVKGNRLWVTDIDVVWVFDLKTRVGRKVELPGVKFANDPTVIGNDLYVSDNRGDQLYRVTPADFLKKKRDPKVTLVFSGKSINPNGLYPAWGDSLLMVGFKSKEETRGIYSLSGGGEPKTLSKPIGRLDGVYQMEDGSLLVTNWNSGSLFSWSAKTGTKTLASGFKGPADFCVFPNAKGLMVVVPDLVKSELRMVQLVK